MVKYVNYDPKNLAYIGKYSIEEDVTKNLVKTHDEYIKEIVEPLNEILNNVVKAATEASKEKFRTSVVCQINCGYDKIFPVVARALNYLHGLKVIEVNHVEHPQEIKVSLQKADMKRHLQLDRKVGKFTDAAFKIQGRPDLEFPCHLVILGSKSSLQFGVEFKEGTPPEMVEFLLAYLYEEEKEIPADLPKEAVMQLLDFSRQFKIKELSLQCIEWMYQAANLDDRQAIPYLCRSYRIESSEEMIKQFSSKLIANLLKFSKAFQCEKIENFCTEWLREWLREQCKLDVNKSESHEAIQLLKAYFCGENIEMNGEVSADVTAQLLRCTEFLGLKDLESKCIQRITKNLKIEIAKEISDYLCSEWQVFSREEVSNELAKILELTEKGDAKIYQNAAKVMGHFMAGNKTLYKNSGAVLKQYNDEKIRIFLLYISAKLNELLNSDLDQTTRLSLKQDMHRLMTDFSNKYCPKEHNRTVPIKISV